MLELLVGLTLAAGLKSFRVMVDYWRPFWLYLRRGFGAGPAMAERGSGFIFAAAVLLLCTNRLAQFTGHPLPERTTLAVLLVAFILLDIGMTGWLAAIAANRGRDRAAGRAVAVQLAGMTAVCIAAGLLL